MAEIHELSLREAAQLIEQRSLSPVTYVSGLLDQIRAHDEQLHSFIEVAYARAEAGAKRAADELASGVRLGPLHGIPYALKDVIDVRGIGATAGSRILADNVASDDAEVVKRLDSAGAVFIGKNSCDEFGVGRPGDATPWAPARNPWNLDYYPGGSSTGSGAAVAAGFVPFALGADTGGSARNPATSSGVVGFKPTRGVVSVRGVFPISPSLDHVGILTRTVEDNAVVLDAIAAERGDFASRIGADISGMRIGYISRFHLEDTVGTDPELVTQLDLAAQRLAGLGADVVDVRTPSLQTYREVHHRIMQFEAFRIHEKWLSERGDQYGAAARKRLEGGRDITIEQYETALAEQRRLIHEFDGIAAEFDALFCASNMGPAPRIDSPDDVAFAGSRHARSPFNLLESPALAVPIGLSSAGLPFGMQIVGRRFSDRTVYQVGHAFECSLGFVRRLPVFESRGREG